MSAISGGATKQVIIPPNEEIVRPRVAIPNEITQRFNLPRADQIRHETILANMLLSRSDNVYVKMPNGELVHKDLVGKPSEMLPPVNRTYHSDDTRARENH